MHFLTVLMLAGISSAAPAKHHAPSVTIKNGTVIGQSASGIDVFNGIPYAKPPTHDLRLRAPHSIDKHYGTLKLPSLAPACPQMHLTPTDTTGIPDQAVGVLEFLSTSFNGTWSEDCLSINVQRPAGIKPGQKLPVLFWIYGGGFETGSTGEYDASAIIGKSVSMNEPIIYVAPNYRVNAFGFLQGKELQAEGNTNLGYRDQRKALEWVAENIEAFGGDPDRVTIWGESAGAISVTDHLLINNGDHKYRGKPLFHGAIMNSGNISPTLPVDSARAQGVFDRLAEAAGCDAAEHGKDTLSCLRKVNTTTFVNAMNSLPDFESSSSNNLAYTPRVDPSSRFYSNYPEKAFAEGKFAHVPVIMGNQEDEATPFAVLQRGIINDTSSLISYFQTWFPNASRKTVADLVATYPDTVSAGLPAGTGEDWELFPQFKRNSAIQSDISFMAGRRQLLSLIHDKVPGAWSYLATYLHGFPLLGTYHTADLNLQFGLQKDSFPGNTMDAAYIDFVNHLDPNGAAGCKPHEQWWPKWDPKHLRLLNVSASETTIIKDDFRWKSQKFIADHIAELRL